MARIDGVLETALYVADLERSSAFYERVLGFGRLLADDRMVALAVGGAPQVLLLFAEGGSTRPTPMHGGLIPAHDGRGSLHLAFAVPAGEADAWRRRIAECGVAIESDLTTEQGGTSLYFRDPDGHLVELATPGIWPTY